MLLLTREEDDFRTNLNMNPTLFILEHDIAGPHCILIYLYEVFVLLQVFHGASLIAALAVRYPILRDYHWKANLVDESVYITQRTKRVLFTDSQVGFPNQRSSYPTGNCQKLLLRWHLLTPPSEISPTAALEL